MRNHIPLRIGSVLAIALGCRVDAEVGTSGFDSASGSDASDTDASADDDASAEGATASSADGTAGEGPKYDVGAGDTDVDPTGAPGSCTVEPGDIDAVPPCGVEAPPDSFDPEVQWSWAGDGEFIYSLVTPLVANLTDDNGDGEVNLCDVPDIVVSVFRQEGCCAPTEAFLYALDGATGALHWKSALSVGAIGMTPAIADLDEDGLVEIIALRPGGSLVAFDGEGQPKWQSADYNGSDSASIAIANLDNAGAAEIIVGAHISDATGVRISPISPPIGGTGSYDASVAADLDDDGDLEVITCGGAMHHDGTVLWQTALPFGYAQVADFDDDGLPEVLCTVADGIAMIEHDGTIAYYLQPGGVWSFPATVHDLDGDEAPDFASGNSNVYVARDAGGSEMWSAVVDDQSGIAGGTAFDFLGDGVAEAMYADHWYFYVFDGQTGNVELEVDRTSGTLIEYPVVADVDNDGSAEAVVVTNYQIQDGDLENLIQTAPTVQVVRDVEDRWVPARRIWNQHTYHVTNVREDGTIPQFETPHWTQLNTFRTQSQIETGGGVCKPEPEG